MSNNELIRWVIDTLREELPENKDVLAIAREVESRWVGGEGS